MINDEEEYELLRLTAIILNDKAQRTIFYETPRKNIFGRYCLELLHGLDRDDFYLLGLLADNVTEDNVRTRD